MDFLMPFICCSGCFVAGICLKIKSRDAFIEKQSNRISELLREVYKLRYDNRRLQAKVEEKLDENKDLFNRAKVLYNKNQRLNRSNGQLERRPKRVN
jgi:hypothetical protein